ncbi:MAG: 50S ribosomal protein L6 [Ignavibacteriae bacterium]|nr:50S ribosomal protein L6 [Ignavibacteriota bacterium]MCB9210028.1 50S ribosomal protein L6 [Ignavibacteriales bacterium]MCB9218587.1 50S ribosomal protein L6 [Ignavibacteriales bacterium]MCB9259407.1 50S ribosomal protein L6 [Ignavibacteriales bacterium]
MSRVGKKPINIKDVEFTKSGNTIKVKGKFGSLEKSFHPNIAINVEGDEVLVTRPNDLRENRALHGLTRALLNNMVEGVSDGYSKTLDIVGVGYKAEQKEKNLLLTIGYSHPIYFMPPDDIKIEVTTPTQIKITGCDKELVGQVAAKIRSFRKPEPYKGKGIKYSNETIIRKAGKTAGK